MNLLPVPVRVFASTMLFLMMAQGMWGQAKSPVEGLRPIAQADRVSASANFATKAKLLGHVPAWANARGEVASHGVDLSSPWRVSITLQRDAAVQAAFEQLLVDQQNPASPMYHQWLTATQIGELYGPTQNDVNALVGWLTSQGLTVIDVAPSRMLIDVDGTLGAVSNAFGTSYSYYKLGDVERRAARTEPLVPAALVPVIAAIGGMAEIYAEPQLHQEKLEHPEMYQKQSSNGVAAPNYTGSSTVYYLTAGDFNTIYDINSVVVGGNTGATIGSLTNSNCPVTTAQCIAIIGRSRVTTADITNYMSSYGGNGQTTYHLTQTAVPSGSGGSDPGITYDGNTGEATLDVQRVVGTANGAQAVLVVSGTVSGVDGTDTATNYNVNTLMYPVMTLSFGLCEANSSAAQQSSRQTIFSQAAAEGISTFVSSGDSAAAGCDQAFVAPPGTQIRSANYLCATGYVTCVGGTEFNDASAYSTYWNASNGTGGLSAKSYIPEGAWNESVSASPYTVTGTGGGVSTYVAKPTFQTGTGVPADGYRDTPDVAFTAANHDGYLGQLTQTSGGAQGTFINSGTSAAAPGMAGIAALLNTKLGYKPGNLNPLIYKLAATNASAFHDVTVTSSGVSGCTTATPSICNNSTPASSSVATGGLAGYAVTAGYDQATGWGSLDVANFLTAAAAANLTVSSAHTGAFLSGSTGDVYTITVTNSGAAATSGTISVVDTLPTGFTATALSGSGWSCTLGTLTCTQTAALAANTSASAITLTVSVSSSDNGTYNNAVTVSLAGTLSDTATDPTVVTSILAPTLSMVYSPAAVAVSGPSTLTLTFSNPNSTASGITLSGVAFSDTFPVNAPISSISQFACTSGSTANQSTFTTSTSLTATLLPQGYCLISLATTSSVAGTYVNTSSTITSTNGGTGAAATATLTVGGKLGVTSTHTGNFRAGDSADIYTVTVTNSSSAVATSGTVTVVDTLPMGFSATAATGTGWTCSTGSTVTCTSATVEAAGASFPAITLTVSVASTDVGTYTNNVAATGGGSTAGAGTDATLVIGVATISAVWSPTTVAPGAHPTLTFTITNPNATTALTGVGLVNNLPSAYVTNYTSTGGTCGGTGMAGATQESISGITLAASSSCTFIVTVTAGSTLGNAVDTSNAVTATNANAGGTASATLTIAVTPTKLVFSVIPPTPITAGGNAGTVSIALEDAGNNVATNNSSTAVMLVVTGPSSYSQTYNATTANGIANFNLSSVGLTVAGTYTYTATSTGLTAAAVTEVVNAGTATSLIVTGLGPFQAPAIAGTALVVARDAYGNVATSFTGTVTLTSTDSSATLPAAYTFVAGDLGSHTYSVKLNKAGTFSVTATCTGPAITGSEVGITVADAVWLLTSTGTFAKVTDAGGLVTTGGTAGPASTSGAVAFDNGGNAWTVMNGSNAVYKFTAAGATATVAGASAAGVSSPSAVAVDGAGYVWIADGNGVLSALTNAGAAQSGTSGYASAAGMTAPSSIAVDNAGSVWVTDKTKNMVVHVLGGATPVTTPLVNAVKNVTLGAKP